MLDDRTYYKAHPAPEIVDVGASTFLTVHGDGSPDSPAFQDAVRAMYSVAWGAKMDLKKAGEEPFRVGALEGLWWTDDSVPWQSDPNAWHWELLIRVPSALPEHVVEMAKREAAAKGITRAQDVRLETIDEGRCIQALHVGPYGTEMHTIDAMDEMARSAGLHFTGHHHEIYLSDPRRVPEDRCRTILRHPVEAG